MEKRMTIREVFNLPGDPLLMFPDVSARNEFMCGREGVWELWGASDDGIVLALVAFSRIDASKRV